MQYFVNIWFKTSLNRFIASFVREWYKIILLCLIFKNSKINFIIDGHKFIFLSIIIFFKYFIIFVYTNNYEIRQNFNDDVRNNSNNESFDIIIDANNYSSIVFNCCKQRIDEIQILFFEELTAIKSNFIEMHNVSFDVFEFDCQLTFKTMSNEMFYIFFISNYHFLTRMISNIIS